MLGGGRNNALSSPGGVQGNYSSSTRRHMNPVTAGVVPASPQLVSPGSFTSPHSLYQQSVDFRTGGSVSMSNDTFPAAPYTTTGNLFMSPDLRYTLGFPTGARNSRPVTNVSSSKFSGYTTIYNVENEVKPSQLFNKLRSQCYHSIARYTGKDIFLRRIVNVHISPEECKMVHDTYHHYRHPNLVTLSDITPTDEFVMGSSDVIMAYRYVVGAKSLQEAFFAPDTGATEGLLWSFTCQLVSLLRSFHEIMVPVRGLHWTKLLYLETTGRFYFTGIGLVDLLDPKPQQSIPALMKLDIQALGLILFQLATRNVNVKVESFNSKQPLPGFSPSFWELIKTCLEGNADSSQLCRALGERMSMEVGHQEGHSEYLLCQCQKEMHNGRIMRLLIKLNFVLESLNDVDYPTDSQRYALRLFSQFLFNQVDESNRVHTDWGHVYHCLNKLDCGSSEMVQLLGGDGGTTVLVVSYADLRQSLETIFERLQQISHSSVDVEAQNFMQ